MNSEPATKNGKTNKRSRGNGHGTVFMDRRRKCWVAEIHDIRGVRRRSTFKGKDDAETWLVTQKQARDRYVCLLKFL